MAGVGDMRYVARLLAPLALVLCVAAAPAPPMTVSLAGQPDIAKDLEALPRIVAPGAPDKAELINRRLALADQRVRKARAACLAEDPKYGFWERGVGATLYGPRFVSLWIGDFINCGGAHPNNDQQALTYDLTTGAPINWARYLPARLVTPADRTESADGAIIGTVKSPALFAWFDRAALAEMDAERREVCGSLYETDPGDIRALVLWLDAERRGVAMQLAYAPHAIRACNAPVIMPVEELRRQGARPVLIEAIEDAHRAHGWADDLIARRIKK